MRLIVFIFMMMAAGEVAGQISYDRVVVAYDSAVSFRNLKLIPVYAKGRGGGSALAMLGLGEAMQRGMVTVSERGTASTENVHWLRIHNNSPHPLLLLSGEMLRGGRQDRMLVTDSVMFPNGRDQYVRVMCVEEGRWSNKEKPFAYFGFVNPALRKTLAESGNQVVIWREIAGQLEAAGIRNKTLAYAGGSVDRKGRALYGDYRQFFQDYLRNSDSSLVGWIAISGNRVLAADIFSNSSLFYMQAGALLEGYIEEAAGKGAVPVMREDAIRAYIDPALRNESEQEVYLRQHGHIFRYQQKVLHIQLFGQ